MNYCRANLTDLLSIEQMEKDCFQTEAFNRRLIKNLLINPKSIVIKAITPSGKIVADIIGITKKVNRIQVGRIFSLCVLKEYCKKGIATHLLKLLEEEFYLNSIRKVVLEVSALNVIAQQFYQRHGYFITSSILPNFYNDGSDAFVMNKNLL